MSVFDNCKNVSDEKDGAAYTFPTERFGDELFDMHCSVKALEAAGRGVARCEKKTGRSAASIITCDVSIASFTMTYGPHGNRLNFYLFI